MFVFVWMPVYDGLLPKQKTTILNFVCNYAESNKKTLRYVSPLMWTVPVRDTEMPRVFLASQ